VADYTLKIKIDADSQAATGALDSLSGTLRGLGDQVTKIGTLALGGIGAALGAVALVGPQVIGMASDTEEALNKVRVVFGESAGAIEEFSSTAAANLGISESAALQATGTFGNLFVTMGLGQPDAAGMSQSIVTLAADLASFNNIDPGEALEKLRAGLVGEAEPLSSLGINLKEAAVQAKAMEMGLADSGGQLSEAAKLQARYALIMEQSATAQGDFARTSNSLANQQRILKATLGDLGGEVGLAFLPAVNGVLLAITPLAQALLPQLGAALDSVRPLMEQVGAAAVTFATTFAQTGDPLAALQAALGGFPALATAFDGIVTGLQNFWTTLQPILQPVIDWVANNVQLNDVLTALGIAIATVIVPALASFVVAAAPVLAVFAALVGAVALVRTAWENDWGGIQEKAAAVWNWLTTNIPPAIETIKTVVTTVLAAIQQFWTDHGAQIMATVSAFWDMVKAAFQAAVDFLRPLIEGALTAIKNFWDAHGAQIIAIVNTLWETLKTNFDTALSVLKSIFQAFKAAFEGDWRGFGENLRAAWDTLWERIKTIVSTAIDSIKAFFQNTDWSAVGRSIIDGIVNGIKSAAGWLADAARDAAKAALDAAKGFLGISSPSKVFAGVGEQMMAGMAQGIRQATRLPELALAQSTPASVQQATPTSTQSVIIYGGVTVTGVQNAPDLLRKLWELGYA
jgi:hypothetical protein